MRRPLYINGGRAPVAVGLDGPALRLQQPQRADARAPLRLLSRIVVSGRVEWTTAALLACGERGVPVAFLRGDGSVRAWCLGDAMVEPEINTLIDDATLQPDFAARHADWMRGLERRAVLAAVQAIGVVTGDLRPSEAWMACEARIDRLAAPVSAAHTMRVFRSALAAHVAGLLRQQGVVTRHILGHGGPIHLTAEMERLLIWHLWPAAQAAALYFCRHGEKHHDQTAISRRLIRRYESSAPMIERIFNDLLWRLRWHLREIAP